MRPKIYQVKKVNQGSGNPESAWAKARFCFMKQLAIRFGQLDPTKIEDPTDQEPNLDAQQSSKSNTRKLSIFFWRRQTRKGGPNSLAKKAFLFLFCFV